MSDKRLTNHITPKVSIIMPSLNVASYIRECMDSVVRQSLSNIEILCIDAGSTDGTWEILKEYAKKDSRIRIVRSDKKSYGYQMNIGLKMAVGEYVGIVETDDFIEPQMYDELYQYAKERDADFVKSDFDVFTSFTNGEKLFLPYFLKQKGIVYHTMYTANDYIYNEQTVDIFIWNGIYKKKFIEDNHILFQETSGAAFQDCGFRYQVALYVKRGFFVNHSYYHYRRDNVNSSTYNSKCVLFNLAECKNLLRIMKNENIKDKERMAFIAREMAVIALCPYTELLTWGTPAEGTEEALNEFRVILREFMDYKVLEQSSVRKEFWMEIRMFVEQPEVYNYYVHLKAELDATEMRNFLHKVVKQKEIIIFGSGYIGSCIYCLLRNNGIQNILAFCDNAPDKFGSMYMGQMVKTPEQAMQEFPDACFIIASSEHVDEMQKQLYIHGIIRRNVIVCKLSLSPMICTNMIMMTNI